MKHLATLFVILLFPFTIAFAQESRGFKPVSLPVEGKLVKLYEQSHALIIGNINYTGGWSRLPGVEKDVMAVKQALEENGFNVIVERNLTKEGIEKAINSFIENYGSNLNNRLLIYYAGHGNTIKTSWGSEQGYIVPVDAPKSVGNTSAFIAKSIEMAQFEIYAKRVQAKHCLFMFDACFSGTMFRSEVVPEAINYKTQKHVRQFITSGSADQEVPDESIFRKYFVNALTSPEADYDKDGYLTGSELGLYLQNNVTNMSRNTQNPQYGKIKEFDLSQGDFVFELAKPAALALPSEVASGTINLTSELSGRFYIDGVFYKDVTAGSTHTINNVTAGVRVLTINGTLNWSEKVMVTAGQTTTVQARIETGSVELYSEIGGKLYVDDIIHKDLAAGTTTTLTKLSVGVHSIKIEGAQNWAENVFVTAGQTTKVSALKVLKTGTLSLASQLDGKLYVDDVFRKQLKAGDNISVAELSEGQHTAIVKDATTSQQLWKDNFTITPGKTAYLTAKGVVVATPAGDNMQNYTEASTGSASGIEMVYVQGGTFTMGCTNEQGSDCFDAEKPAHSVTVSNFYIGKYEVTQAQWRAIMGASATLSNPSYFKNCDECPVEQVSWNDIQEFLKKLNAKTGKTYRLPTEAEWEYAARSGSKSNGYKYSGSNDVGSVALYDGNSNSKTHPVGQKNPNELGIYDMSGNVWEWCSDWYSSDYYKTSPTNNPENKMSTSDRIVRGGGWSTKAAYVRCGYRGNVAPSNRRDDLGFRLVFVP